MLCAFEDTEAQLDETVPRSQTLRTLRDWIPYLTLFFCVVGFTITIMGYNDAPRPLSQKTIPRPDANGTFVFPHSDISCDTGLIRFFRVACFEFGENEGFLMLYAVYYHGLAILGCFQKDAAFVIQYFWSSFGFPINLIVGFGGGAHFLAPVLGPEFVVVTILFVLSALKKGSGTWSLISLYCLGEHKDKPLEVIRAKKPEKIPTRENFSGILIL